MAGGIFDKGVSEVRPGTYVKFTDVHDYEADESDEDVIVGGSAGNGAQWAVPDFTIGYEEPAVVTEAAETTNYTTEYLTAKTTRVCGEKILQEAY